MDKLSIQEKNMLDNPQELNQYFVQQSAAYDAILLSTPPAAMYAENQLLQQHMDASLYCCPRGKCSIGELEALQVQIPKQSFILTKDI